MGWAMMIAVGLGAAGLLLAFGVRRGMWSTVGAALMLGAIGYAVQGRPGLPDHPVAANAEGVVIDPGITALRGAIFGRFGEDSAYLTASDGLQRAGETESAVRLMLGAVQHKPGDAALWTELGTAIAAHDGGTVSPAAALAFRRAAQLAPDSPGPWFFAGLAQVRAGNFAQAQPLWQRAQVLTPKDAPYRSDIMIRMALLDRYMSLLGASGG